jgi:hypothetical protein
MPILISTVPVADEDWIKAQLALTSKDFHAFKSINAFFYHTRSLDIIGEQ